MTPTDSIFLQHKPFRLLFQNRDLNRWMDCAQVFFPKTKVSNPQCLRRLSVGSHFWNTVPTICMARKKLQNSTCDVKLAYKAKKNIRKQGSQFPQTFPCLNISRTVLSMFIKVQER
jgi:hypothetical protein